MLSPPELTKVRRIAELTTGMSPSQITFVARGATSAAWHVTNGTDAVIVRIIPTGTNRPVTYQSEFTILRLLKNKGCLVPIPIMNNAECSDQLNDIKEDWAVTEVINGQAVKNGRLPPIAKDLGRQIAILHTLPFKGYGRLKEQREQIQGLQNDQQSGICARWCWANIWPFDASSLAEHPVSVTDPHLVKQLLQLKPHVLELLANNEMVVTHSDLHGEHIFVQDGKLTGLIDFGVSFIGMPAWEFAVLAYHHGWVFTQEVLRGYSPSREAQENLLKQAQMLVIVVGLYKLAKSVTKNASQEKVMNIRKFINEQLKC